MSQLVMPGFLWETPFFPSWPHWQCLQFGQAHVIYCSSVPPSPAAASQGLLWDWVIPPVSSRRVRGCPRDALLALVLGDSSLGAEPAVSSLQTQLLHWKNINRLALGKLSTKHPPKQQRGGRRRAFTFSRSQSCVIKPQPMRSGFPRWRRRDGRSHGHRDGPSANQTPRNPPAAQGVLAGGWEAGLGSADVLPPAKGLRPSGRGRLQAWPWQPPGLAEGTCPALSHPAFWKDPPPTSAAPPGAQGAAGPWAAPAPRHARVGSAR